MKTNPRFDSNLPRGFSKRALRSARTRFDFQGRVDIHHVIPREYKCHAVIKRENYDVEEAYNLVLLPNLAGANIATRRPIHNERHANYNTYVGNSLDACDSRSALLALLLVLHNICRGKRSL